MPRPDADFRVLRPKTSQPVMLVDRSWQTHHRDSHQYTHHAKSLSRKSQTPRSPPQKSSWNKSLRARTQRQSEPHGSLTIEYRQSVCQSSNEIRCVPSCEIERFRACEGFSVPNGDNHDYRFSFLLCPTISSMTSDVSFRSASLRSLQTTKPLRKT